MDIVKAQLYENVNFVRKTLLSCFIGILFFNTRVEKERSKTLQT